MWIVVLLTYLFSFSVCFVCGGGWFIVFSFFSDHKSWCSSSSIEWHLTYTQGVLWDATGRTNEILQQGYECTLQCGSIATSALDSTLERWVNCNLFQGDGYYVLAYKTYNIYVSLPASIIPVSSLLFPVLSILNFSIPDSQEAVSHLCYESCLDIPVYEKQHCDKWHYKFNFLVVFSLQRCDPAIQWGSECAQEGASECSVWEPRVAIFLHWWSLRRISKIKLQLLSTMSWATICFWSSTTFWSHHDHSLIARPCWRPWGSW